MKAIKVKYVRSEKNQHKWLEFDRVLAPELTKANVVSVEGVGADLCLCDTRCFEVSEFTPTGLPTILLDFYDCPNLQFNGARHALQSDDVLALFSNYKYSDISQYNEGLAGLNSYHVGVLASELNFCFGEIGAAECPISIESFNKIQSVLFNIDSSPYRRRLLENGLHPDFITEYFNETIDKARAVFFAGATNYTNEILSMHRSCCVRELSHLSPQDVYVSECRLSYKGYLNELKRSMATVSPWGYGAWCHRDYEAAMCGAVIIKPPTKFLFSDLMSFGGGGIDYLQCDYDFRDLPEIVQKLKDEPVMAFELISKNLNYMSNFPRVDELAGRFRQSLEEFI